MKPASFHLYQFSWHGKMTYWLPLEKGLHFTLPANPSYPTLKSPEYVCILSVLSILVFCVGRARTAARLSGTLDKRQAGRHLTRTFN